MRSWRRDSHLAPADYVVYKVFFEAARSNAKSQWGAGLSVGTAVTWDSLTTPGPEQAAILDLDEHADHVLTTYYGINADLTVKDPYAGPVADIYAALLAVDSNAKTRGHTIDLIEVAYPTSAALNSSQAYQQIFISTMFGIWDAFCPRSRCAGRRATQRGNTTSSRSTAVATRTPARSPPPRPVPRRCRWSTSTG